MYTLLALIQTLCIPAMESNGEISKKINQTIFELEKKAADEKKEVELLDIIYNTTLGTPGCLYDTALIVYEINDPED